MKDLLKKWAYDVLKGLGVTIILIVALSYFPDLFKIAPEHKHHYLMFLLQIARYLVITCPVIGFVEQVIMKYQLFSKKLEKRRIINTIICLCICLLFINFFGIIPKELSKLMTVATILFGPVTAAIAYIIEDRTKKKDISEINRQLSRLNKM